MRNFNISFYLLLALSLGCSKSPTAPPILPLPVPVSVHLSLGNPTDARPDVATPDNYLMLKDQYALSYNKAKGSPNWVCWELSTDWLGDVDRLDDFRSDPDLPADWYKVLPADYTNSGFDRGHMCPSADRTRTTIDNSSTFLMSNMVPPGPPVKPGTLGAIRGLLPYFGPQRVPSLHRGGYLWQWGRREQRGSGIHQGQNHRSFAQL